MVRRRTFRRIAWAFATLILPFLLFAATFSISEYSARTTLAHRVDLATVQVLKDYATIPPSTDGKSLIDQRHSHQTTILVLREIKSRLENTQQSGARDAYSTVQFLSEQFVGALSNYSPAQINPEATSSPSSPTNSFDILVSWFSIAIGKVLYFIAILSSDILLAFITIACCGIAAVVAGIRRNDILAVYRDLLVGLTSGFVVYVVVRGGKYVFLMQQGDVPLNPYGLALCGLLTGMFTERAYNILGSVVDQIEEKVKVAFGKTPDAPANQAQTPEQAQPGAPPQAQQADAQPAAEEPAALGPQNAAANPPAASPQGAPH